MQVLEKLKIRVMQKNKPEFQVLIFKHENSKNSNNSKILGRALSDWVAFACGKLPVKIIEWNKETSILEESKKHIKKDNGFTVILLSSTPLISSKTISEIIDYCTTKNVKLCKLPVGYVVNNEYISTNTELCVDSLYSQNIDEFFVVENKKQFAYAEDILQDRINTFHINNGVEIRRPRSVYIEPEVDIASGVVIFPGNCLKGSTIVGSGAILKENNVIDDSKIGKDSCISSSQIIGSVLGHNVYVSAFSEIINSMVGNESVISSSCKIYNTKIKDKSNLKVNTVLGENNDTTCGAR